MLPANDGAQREELRLGSFAGTSCEAGQMQFGIAVKESGLTRGQSEEVCLQV